MNKYFVDSKLSELSENIKVNAMLKIYGCTFNLPCLIQAQGKSNQSMGQVITGKVKGLFWKGHIQDRDKQGQYQVPGVDFRVGKGISQLKSGNSWGQGFGWKGYKTKLRLEILI